MLGRPAAARPPPTPGAGPASLACDSRRTLSRPPAPPVTTARPVLGLFSGVVAGATPRPTCATGVSARGMSRAVRPSSLPPRAAQQVLRSVLASLASIKTRDAYRTAILDFLKWFESSSKPLVKSSVEAWRVTLIHRGLAPSSVNQRLSAIRLFFRHAQEQGVVGAAEALEFLTITNVKLGLPLVGPWLTADEAGRLLSVPDPNTVLGQRDRAILALLVTCGLRREELVHLEIRHLQRREGRWVLFHFPGKGSLRRTVPLPSWVKGWIDQWLAAAAIEQGPLFRRVRKNGAVDPEDTPLSGDSIYSLVKQAGAAIGKTELTLHDLRRTCAQLCRKAGGDLEQIQLLLGHASFGTTERYLGTKQDLRRAVNDRVKIPVKPNRGCKV